MRWNEVGPRKKMDQDDFQHHCPRIYLLLPRRNIHRGDRLNKNLGENQMLPRKSMCEEEEVEEVEEEGCEVDMVEVERHALKATHAWKVEVDLVMR